MKEFKANPSSNGSNGVSKNGKCPFSSNIIKQAAGGGAETTTGETIPTSVFLDGIHLYQIQWERTLIMPVNLIR